jgi:hypothetical protein
VEERDPALADREDPFGGHHLDLLVEIVEDRLGYGELLPIAHPLDEALDDGQPFVGSPAGESASGSFRGPVAVVELGKGSRRLHVANASLGEVDVERQVQRHREQGR